jgi:hypothetical protein
VAIALLERDQPPQVLIIIGKNRRSPDVVSAAAFLGVATVAKLAFRPIRFVLLALI